MSDTIADKERILETTAESRGIKTMSVKFPVCGGEEIEFIRRTPSDKTAFDQVNNMLGDLGVQLSMNVVKKGGG